MAIVVTMALGGRRFLDVQNLKVVQAEFTVQAADFPVTGFPLASNLSSIGLTTIVSVLEANLRTSAGVAKTVLLNYNRTTGLLMAATTVSNTDGGTAAAAVNDDVLAVTILGY